MNHRGTQKVASRQAKRTHTAATFRARPVGGLHTRYKYGTATVQLRAAGPAGHLWAHPEPDRRTPGDDMAEARSREEILCSVP